MVDIFFLHMALLSNNLVAFMYGKKVKSLLLVFIELSGSWVYVSVFS